MFCNKIIFVIHNVLILLGFWRRGKMEGKGVYRYKHGDSYEGTFMQSAPYGEGKYVYADGGYYQGEFKNLTHLNKHKGIQGLHRLPKCDGWRHGFGVVRFITSPCLFYTIITL